MDQEIPFLKSLQHKEEKAYRFLYLNYYVPLVLFARKYVTDEEIAKDLVQDFFISMLQQEVTFKNLVALKVYLYNGVKNRKYKPNTKPGPSNPGMNPKNSGTG